MIIFSNHEVGVILSLENSVAAAIVLGSDFKLIPGDFVFRTQKLMGIFVSGSLLGSVVNPLGRSLTANKVESNDKFFGFGKYINFRDIFSIFFIDFTELKNLSLYDSDELNFQLVEEEDNSLLNEKHILGFMGDYSKFLVSKKTSSIFMDVKDFFEVDDIHFVKSEIRSRKLFNFIFEIKTNSPMFNRFTNMKSWYLKYRQDNNLWFLNKDLNNLISFLDSGGVEVNSDVSESDDELNNDVSESDDELNNNVSENVDKINSNVIENDDKIKINDFENVDKINNNVIENVDKIKINISENVDKINNDVNESDDELNNDVNESDDEFNNNVRECDAYFFDQHSDILSY